MLKLAKNLYEQVCVSISHHVEKRNAGRFYQSEDTILAAVELEPRMMLNGDGSDQVADDYAAFIPEAFGALDIGAYTDLVGGEEFVEIPAKVRDQISESGYSWDLRFEDIFSFTEHDPTSGSATKYSYSSVPANDDATEYYVSLNRFTYSFDVTDGDGGFGGGGFGGAGGAYTETLDIERYSQLVKTSDLTGAEQFELDGNFGNYSDYLFTSTSEWDYSFQIGSDFSGATTIDITLNYDATFDFHWQEDVSFTELFGTSLFQSQLGATAESESIVYENGTLSINGSSIASVDGQLLATETDNGFEYEVSGSHSNQTTGAGIVLELDADGVYQRGNVQLDAEHKLVDRSIEGGVFHYDILTNLTNTFIDQRSFSGSGSVDTSGTAPVRTGELSLGIGLSRSDYTKSIDTTVSGEVVILGALPLIGTDVAGNTETEYTDGGESSELDLVDEVYITSEMAINHQSAGFTTLAEVNGQFIDRTIHDNDSATEFESIIAQSTLSSFSSTVFVSRQVDVNDIIGGNRSLEETETRTTNIAFALDGPNNSTTTSQLIHELDLGSRFIESTTGTETTTSNINLVSEIETSKVGNSTRKYGDNVEGYSGDGVEGTYEEQIDDQWEIFSSIESDTSAASTTTLTHSADGSILIVTNADTTITTKILAAPTSQSAEGDGSTDFDSRPNRSSATTAMTRHAANEGYYDVQNEETTHRKEYWHGTRVDAYEFDSLTIELTPTEDDDLRGLIIEEYGEDFLNSIRLYESQTLSGSITEHSSSDTTRTVDVDSKIAGLAIHESETTGSEQSGGLMGGVPIGSHSGDYNMVLGVEDQVSNTETTQLSDVTKTTTFGIDSGNPDTYSTRVHGTENIDSTHTIETYSYAESISLGGVFDNNHELKAESSLDSDWNSFDRSIFNSRDIRSVEEGEELVNSLGDEDQGFYNHTIVRSRTESDVSELAHHDFDWNFVITPGASIEFEVEPDEGSEDEPELIEFPEFTIEFSGNATRAFAYSNEVEHLDKESKSLEIYRLRYFDNESMETVTSTVMKHTHEDVLEAKSLDERHIIVEDSIENGVFVSVVTGMLGEGHSQRSHTLYKAAINSTEIITNVNNEDPTSDLTAHGMNTHEVIVTQPRGEYSHLHELTVSTQITTALVEHSDAAAEVVDLLRAMGIGFDVTAEVLNHPETEGEQGGSSTGDEETGNRVFALANAGGSVELGALVLSGSDSSRNFVDGVIKTDRKIRYEEHHDIESDISIRMQTLQPFRQLIYTANIHYTDKSRDVVEHTKTTITYDEGSTVVDSERNKTAEHSWEVRTNGSYGFYSHNEIGGGGFDSLNVGEVDFRNKNELVAVYNDDATGSYDETIESTTTVHSVNGHRNRYGRVLAEDEDGNFAPSNLVDIEFMAEVMAAQEKSTNDDFFINFFADDLEPTSEETLTFVRFETSLVDLFSDSIQQVDDVTSNLLPNTIHPSIELRSSAFKTFAYAADEVVQYAGYMSPFQGEQYARQQRIWGLVNVIGGLIEVTEGVVLLLSGNVPMGVIAIAHGRDTFQAGVKSIVTGDSARTETSKAIAAMSELAGYSTHDANFIGELGDVLLGFSGSAAVTKAAKAPKLATTTKHVSDFSDGKKAIDEGIDATSKIAARESAQSVDEAAKTIAKTNCFVAGTLISAYQTEMTSGGILVAMKPGLYFADQNGNGDLFGIGNSTQLFGAALVASAIVAKLHSKSHRIKTKKQSSTGNTTTVVAPQRFERLETFDSLAGFEI